MRRHNKEEAQALVEDIVRQYENLSYDELRIFAEDRKIKTEERKGASGEEYQIELTAVWENRDKGIIRFSGAIYDNSKSRLFGIKTPISYDFLKEK